MPQSTYIIETENRIMTKLVEAAFAAGYTISVNDGEDTILKRSSSLHDIMCNLRSTEDGDTFIIHAGDRQTDKPLGWVQLIYGNDGHDVISDYTTNLETLLEGVNRYADNIAATA